MTFNRLKMDKCDNIINDNIGYKYNNINIYNMNIKLNIYIFLDKSI